MRNSSLVDGYESSLYILDLVRMPIVVPILPIQYSAHIKCSSKHKHILASVGAIQVLVPYSVQTRFNPIAYKGISLLGLSHDPCSYLGEIGCRSSTQTRKT